MLAYVVLTPMFPSNGITPHGKTNLCGEATKKPKNRSSTKDLQKFQQKVTKQKKVDK